MEAPKVKLDYSDAVEKAVKQIAGLQGKKRKIDTAYEYEQLARLLADVQAGKLDKNFVKNDELYIKGLQLEYQQRYLGEENNMSGGSVPQQNNTNVKSEDKKPNPQAQQKIEPESKKDKNGEAVPAPIPASGDKRPNPQVQPKIEPESKKNENSKVVPAPIPESEDKKTNPQVQPKTKPESKKGRKNGEVPVSIDPAEQMTPPRPPKFKPGTIVPMEKKRVQSENSGEKTNVSNTGKAV